jgi:hypothetical protein
MKDHLFFQRSRGISGSLHTLSKLLLRWRVQLNASQGEGQVLTLPKWARFDPGKTTGAFVLTPTHRHKAVRIVNPEISWEPFHARIIGAAAAAGVRVHPASGVLAPRGGANNVCDPSKPYSDGCDLEVTMPGDFEDCAASFAAAAAAAEAAEAGRRVGAALDGADGEGAVAGHLVVCLEQCRWTWEIRIRNAE